MNRSKTREGKLNLKKLKELGEKATEGPWASVYDGGNDYSIGPGDDPQEKQVFSHYSREFKNPDIEWVIKARNTWEEMIGALEEIREIIREFKNHRYIDNSALLDIDIDRWLERFEDD